MPKENSPDHAAATAPERPPAPQGAVWRAADHTLVEWTPTHVTVTRPWPLPRCWVKATAHGARWRETHGSIHWGAWREGAAERATWSAQRARVAAWSTVPPEVRAAVARSALSSQGWATLSMLARCPGAMDLAQSVPLLCGALAASRWFRGGWGTRIFVPGEEHLHPEPNPLQPATPGAARTPVRRPLRSARALLRVPDGMARWRRVAAWLGFDASAAFVNLLRRAGPAADAADRHAIRWGVGEMRSLHALWQDRLGRKRLSHARRVDPSVAAFLHVALRNEVLDQVHPELVDCAHGEGIYGGSAAQLSTTVEAWRAMHPSRPLPSWRSIEAMEATLVRLGDDFRGGRGGEAAPPFPPPPLPGNEHVTPLDSPRALDEEGREMGHCMGNGGWELESRHAIGYGYRVQVAGERASLWIRRAPDAPVGFCVNQLRGPNNRTPSAALFRAVAAWMQWLGEGPPLLPPWSEPARPLARNTLPPWAAGDDDIPF